EDLLRATEEDLETVQRAVMRTRAPLRGAAAIGLKVGAVLNAHKMGKHFETEITDTGFTFRRKTDAIAEEARLDGFYVIRTSVPEETLDDTGTVRAYKSLAKVERAFRTLKAVDLQVRPIHHWLEPRVRAHVFLCMLSYYVEWHMRRRLAPMLFHDADPAAAEAERDSIVAPAVPSPSAQAKVRTGVSDVGTPVMSFRSLLADLATIARNTVSTALAPDHRFTITTRPTAIQCQAFDLLGVSPDCSQ
ncbi:MAG: IS1634 family transposase, partial [Candidatus Competibacteraceae bacterium]|nr:IS1634 family transposase [Candidatus Competibacteraceae bacterium]